MSTRVDPEIKRKFFEKAVSEGMEGSTLLKKLVYSYLKLESEFSDLVVLKSDVFNGFQKLVENMAVRLGFVCRSCHQPFHEKYLSDDRELSPSTCDTCFEKVLSGKSDEEIKEVARDIAEGVKKKIFPDEE